MTYSYHEQMKMLGASGPMIAAMDILGDAGLLNEQRLKVLVVGEQEGLDPESTARKLVRLCRDVQARERSEEGLQD